MRSAEADSSIAPASCAAFPPQWLGFVFGGGFHFRFTTSRVLCPIFFQLGVVEQQQVVQTTTLRLQSPCTAFLVLVCSEWATGWQARKSIFSSGKLILLPVTWENNKKSVFPLFLSNWEQWNIIFSYLRVLFCSFQVCFSKSPGTICLTCTEHCNWLFCIYLWERRLSYGTIFVCRESLLFFGAQLCAVTEC